MARLIHPSETFNATDSSVSGSYLPETTASVLSDSSFYTSWLSELEGSGITTENGPGNSSVNPCCAICQQPQGNRNFMLDCDSCGAWLHGKCAKLSIEEVSVMIENKEKYLCPTCEKNQACPICHRHYPLVTNLWHHINNEHAARSVFPPLSFYHHHNRLICSSIQCHYPYHQRYANTGCQRPQNWSKCGSYLMDPSDITSIQFMTPTVTVQSPPPQERNEPPSPSPLDDETLLSLALQAMC